MMIETLISMVRYLSARKDDDFADRMNYLYTPNMLLAFSVLISFKQFGGRPLECMFPNKFPGSWEQYAENYCWSEDTYYLPPEMHVAQVEETQRYSSERKLSYYQWVPFFLLLQAACFRLPSLIWKAISLSSGVRVHDIVTKAMDSQNVEELSRKRTLQVLAQHLARALRFQNQILRRNLFVDKTLSCLNVTTSASFISVMYLLNKLLYLGNVLVQLYLMNKFLGTDRYQWYGLSVFADIMAGIPWTSSGYFPRVSLCDFTVRQVANIQKYSVQCVLVINIFTEKIFILLWFWYALLLVVTSISILYWALMMFFPQFGRWYIAQALELDQADLFKKAEEKQLLEAVQKKRLVRRFVDEFLRTDGVFTLRMLGIHAGILFTSELVSELYRIHEEVLQSSGESLTFSEDATLKLEDGTVVAASFVKAESPQKQNGHRDSLKHRKKRESERRHGSAPADVAETATALVPLVSEAGNRPSSSSSSSSESSRQNDDADDDNGRRNK